jgi:secreted trypsin-like serine protease
MTAQAFRLCLLFVLVTPLAHATGPASSLARRTQVTFKATRAPGGGRRTNLSRTDASAEKAREVRSRMLGPAVVGGTEAKPGAWPFAVAIAFENQQGTLTQYCAGSLISPDTVLTAAHCEVAAGHFALIGRHDLSKDGGWPLRIVSVSSHVRFDPHSFQNDIALLRLAAPVPDVSPVELAAQDLEVPPGQTVTVIGWGATGEGAAPSFVLREASFPVAGQAECTAQYKNHYPIVESMLCASAPGTKDSCQGDSGGPLLMKTPQGKVLQVGITSFGVGCARPGFHGVYTRVSAFRPWMGLPLSH